MGSYPIQIDHTVTEDLDGQPWPPIGGDWHLVRTVSGRSLWRRITLAERQIDWVEELQKRESK